MLVTLGCSPATAPIAPTTPPINPLAPFSLTVGMSVGLGADAGRAEITAKVQGPTGAPLGNVLVAFATDTGTLSADQVSTTDNGVASTTLTASSSAHLTATAGTLSSRLLVPSEPPPPAPPASTTPTGPPSSDPGSLTVSLDATSALTGASMLVTANVRNVVVPASYLWTFGDGTSFRGLSASTAHTYAAAGSYSVTVSVTDAAGRSAAASSTATVTDPPAPADPPAPTPRYTVTLTAAPTSLVVLNTSTLTAFVVAQNGAPTPTSYDWDCNADGVTDANTAINSTTCPYNTVGTITSKVTVNGTGATGVGSTTVTVLAAAPLAVAIVPDNFSPAIGATVNFTATLTSAGSVVGPFRWDWDFDGDGVPERAIASAPNPNVQPWPFGTHGVQTVKVVVTDTTIPGRTATGTVKVTVP
jgi:large repetitive protein